MTVSPLAIFLVSLAVAAGLTPLVRLVARQYGLVVRPREDRWHTSPTALYGGVAIAAAACAGFAMLFLSRGSPVFDVAVPAVLVASVTLFVVGVADDARGIAPVGKLIWQVAAGSLLVWAGLIMSVTPWLPVNVLVTLLWFVGISNALNLLDNMDGVAAGVAAVAALGFALLYSRAEDLALAGIAVSAAGAALGFLLYNFKPASIFMGDAGSLFLGSILAGLGAAYSQSTATSGPLALLVPVLILLVPVIDTTLVTFTRVLNNRRISVGGRDHTTHRLVAMGFAEGHAALFLYTCGMLSLAIAWLIARAEAGTAVWLGMLFLTGALVFAGYLGTLYQYDSAGSAQHRRSALLRTVLVKRRGFMLLLDIMLFGAAYYGAFVIFYEFHLPPRVADLAGSTVGIVIALKLLAFNYFKVYRTPWNQSTLADVHQVVKATLLGSLLLVTGAFIVARGAQIPRTVFVLDLFMTGALALAARTSFQSLDRLSVRLRSIAGTPTIIYSLPEEAELVLAAVSTRAELGLQPVAVLTDNDELVGEYIRGIPVVGWGDELNAFVRDMNVQVVVRCNRASNNHRRHGLAGLELPEIQFTAEFTPTVMAEPPASHATSIGS